MITEREDRVLILGSNICGASSLHQMLESALLERKMTSTRVEHIRYLHEVEPKIRQPEPPVLRGVILFPEMRQMLYMLPRFVHVYEEGVDRIIRQLCREQNVPLFEMRNWKPAQGVRSLRKLLK
ncbi:hypothetical protein KBC80_04245 [Candidatus Woesebacteria bacterium]|nr:hypothetical protein [Candidatus Woesebacteria bacterium]